MEGSICWEGELGQLLGGQECLFLDLGEDYTHLFSFTKNLSSCTSICAFFSTYFSVGMLEREIIHVQIYCKHKESCLERNLAIANKIVYAFYPLTQ